MAIDINEAVKLGFTIGALFVAYQLGIRSYFKQKDYELVRQRYLIDGTDEVAANIEYALSVYRNNWARGLEIIRMFRDVGDKINPKMLDEGFIAFDQTKFKMQPHHRVARLVGDMVFWTIQQKIAAFVVTATGHIKEDLCTEIRLRQSCTPEERKAIVDKYEKLLLKTEGENLTFFLPLEKMNDLSRLLEISRFSTSEIDQFKDKGFVKETVQLLKQKFPSVIES